MTPSLPPGVPPWSAAGGRLPGGRGAARTGAPTIPVKHTELYNTSLHTQNYTIQATTHRTIQYRPPAGGSRGGPDRSTNNTCKTHRTIQYRPPHTELYNTGLHTQNYTIQASTHRTIQYRSPHTELYNTGHLPGSRGAARTGAPTIPVKHTELYNTGLHTQNYTIQVACRGVEGRPGQEHQQYL